MKLSACGVDCETCPHLGGICQGGCEALEGGVYWTKYIQADVCPIYSCAKNKKYRSCGDCSQLPCEMWYTLKDPSHTDAEHQKSITERTEVLKKLTGKP